MLQVEKFLLKQLKVHWWQSWEYKLGFSMLITLRWVIWFFLNHILIFISSLSVPYSCINYYCNMNNRCFQNVMYYRHCSKCFTCTYSFRNQISPVVLLLFPFYSWENWGSNKLPHLSLHLVSGRAKIHTQIFWVQS